MVWCDDVYVIDSFSMEIGRARTPSTSPLHVLLSHYKSIVRFLYFWVSPCATKNSKMAEERRFSKREYAISCMFTLLFTMLVSASYFDISTCPYNSRGGALRPGFEVAPVSIFSATFSVVPCHTLDIVVWMYVAMFCYFMAYKWFMYKAERHHYFMIDYCYFHNMSLCVLVVSLLVKIDWVCPFSAGFFSNALCYPASFDIVPVATAVGSLTREKLSVTMFVFFVILAGSFGPILGAILMWKNALLYHSFDKMISCYLHLAPAAVQGLLIHAALSSVKHRASSKLRDFLRGNTSFITLLGMHFLMFVVWQIFYHIVHEIRLAQRSRKFYKMLEVKQKMSPATPIEEQERAALFQCIVARTTSYTWMMDSPPLGKKGPLYRFVTCFGTARFTTTLMFAVAQLLIHASFFVLGFGPIYFALIVYESAWPLLMYTCMYVLLCIYNAAAVNKSWIKKLTLKAAAADVLRTEVDALRREVEALRKQR